MPPITSMSTGSGTVSAVLGNTAVITPAPASLVTVVAPATVKKLAATPSNLKNGLGSSVIVAV